jgi:hypothetical protein
MLVEPPRRSPCARSPSSSIFSLSPPPLAGLDRIQGGIVPRTLSLFLSGWENTIISWRTPSTLVAKLCWSNTALHSTRDIRTSTPHAPPTPSTHAAALILRMGGGRPPPPLPAARAWVCLPSRRFGFTRRAEHEPGEAGVVEPAHLRPADATYRVPRRPPTRRRLRRRGVPQLEPPNHHRRRAAVGHRPPRERHAEPAAPAAATAAREAVIAGEDPRGRDGAGRAGNQAAECGGDGGGVCWDGDAVDGEDPGEGGAAADTTRCEPGPLRGSGRGERTQAPVCARSGTHDWKGRGRRLMVGPGAKQSTPRADGTARAEYAGAAVRCLRHRGCQCAARSETGGAAAAGRRQNSGGSVTETWNPPKIHTARGTHQWPPH